MARLADQIIDPSARGHVTYGTTANAASFQQDGIFTYGGWQYVAWYDADRSAIISRRQLPQGAWQSIALDYDLYLDDSHNTISMAVTPSDGRIHIAFGTHTNRIYYTRSVPGVATTPGTVTWSSQLFEATRGSIPGAPDAPTTLGYPQFEMVGSKLLLTYRDGSSTNGRQVILRYDDNGQATWTYLGRFSSSAGTYTSPYGTSTTRYAYLHGFAQNPVTGNLEISFSWREQTSAWCSPTGLGNHDLGYAYSPDGGATWRNNAGTTIGVTGTSDLISIDDAHVVVPVSINRGLINQEHQAFDSQGRIHVMTSMFNDADLAAIGGCHTDTLGQRATYARPYHHWRDAGGQWHSTELPTYSGAAGRTKLLFDSEDDAYVVLPDARIMVATAASGWTDWQQVFSAQDVDIVGEPIIDRTRLEGEEILTVVYQEPSTADAPSALRIANFELRSTAPDAPKSTTPAATPAPYSGSAPSSPAASASSSHPSYPASRAADGQASTFWVSSGTQAGDGPTATDPETLTVEYGYMRALSSVTVVPRLNYGPKAFRIQVRVNNQWQQVASVQQANATASHSFATTSADAVRLVITDAYDTISPSRNVQVAEIAAYPSISASSSHPSYPASRAADGQASTFWVSSGTQAGDGPTATDPETLTVEYGYTRAVSSVTVVPRLNYGPKAFRIQVRVNNQWQQVASVQQANATASHSFATTSADAVRLVITDAYDTISPSRNVQVAELSASG